jgi:radical SAM superfamily enzyme YgiQ (UPF0313 family)
VRVLLVSTYELGRQPFGLASPAAWLREAGHDVVCVDASRDRVADEALSAADVIGFYLPMHTATRLALPLLARARATTPAARICAFGLYAPLNEAVLREAGVAATFGGEFEELLTDWLANLGTSDRGTWHPRSSDSGTSDSETSDSGTSDSGTSDSGTSDLGTLEGVTLDRGTPARSPVSLPRLHFRVPDRTGLPPLERYASLQMPNGIRRITGYTEASRGCKHWCRHCPIVPVYGGRFRIVAPETVMADVRTQVARGAEHITFGDPDFFNGIGHALAVVRAFARECPGTTYDVTIKIEHILKHADALPVLAETGCVLVTSAAESVDDTVLARLQKGHTRADLERAVAVCRESGIALAPTFVAFTPWTTLDGYIDLLQTLLALDVVDQVAPIQLAIRLLIPNGSRLLELEEVRRLVRPFDGEALVYPWSHPDIRVDALQRKVETIVGARTIAPRCDTFAQLWDAAHDAAARPAPPLPLLISRAAVPFLTEPWYC